MAMISGCPGAAGVKGTPTLAIKICPDCGEELELFSNEMQTQCKKCGFIAYNQIQSCVLWCRYARECVGDETVDRLTGAAQP